MSWRRNILYSMKEEVYFNEGNRTEWNLLDTVGGYVCSLSLVILHLFALIHNLEFLIFITKYRDIQLIWKWAAIMFFSFVLIQWPYTELNWMCVHTWMTTIINVVVRGVMIVKMFPVFDNFSKIVFEVIYARWDVELFCIKQNYHLFQ